jgi:transposase InsO family protein
MSKARLVLTALFVEHQSPTEVAARYGVHRAWVYRLKARYEAEGEAAFEPRSRRPKTSPTAVPDEVVELIVRLRKQLAEQGLDAGPDTIAWHLRHHHQRTVAVSTIARYLSRRGLVVPEPNKRPKASYIRFEADQPNQTWQADFTHYRLTRPDGRPGGDAEILSWIDDHSRYALSVTAHHRVTGPIVLAAFRRTCSAYGVPASTLTDNGMVFTTRYAGGRGGRNAFEAELRRLGVVQKNSRPNHPTTCGKAERFQQTLKKWLAAPGDRARDTHDRVRTDIVDQAGSVTLRVNGRLHHIGVGRTHARTPVLLLVHDLNVRIVNAATGELLRDLVLDPTRDYQPTGAPKGPTRRT